MPTRAQFVRAACVLEANAPKPGNVHPGASFDDLTYADFVASADAVSEIVAAATPTTIGKTIRDAVAATRAAVGTNTNLGLLLLITPLAAVPDGVSLADGIADVLHGLSVEDAEQVYEAIRIAQPGGLGDADDGDVRSGPSGTLLEMMTLAADRDRVAWQYAHGFADVLDFGLRELAQLGRWIDDVEQRVVHLALALLCRTPDSLIARKCGADVAADASRRASMVFAHGWPDTEQGRTEFERFDAWLRDDGRRRNPGTTADLVGATLFAALRENVLTCSDEVP